ncbi:MAG: hypothetical protein OEM93_22780 [Rhodospirillales bacterium]|nr:hypothetical protein [Rhodospirillales bacterium]MDH3968472.1 hypothetical protein [Rhodospirillales bacterium]
MRHSNLSHGLSLSTLVLLFLFDVTAAQEPDPFNSHPGLREIGKLPDGIRVTHTPNPVRAQPGGRSGFKYTWEYKTTVESITGPIFIQEFVSFYLTANNWEFSNFTRKPFTPADFAEWYSCPKALLKPGTPCSDPLNWTGNNQLVSGKMLWLFIGRDNTGKQYKGHAVIELNDAIGSTD